MAPRVTRARTARHAAAAPADNPLACAGPPDITSGLRGKGGGPTACMAVGLARWLSASRRPAGRAGGGATVAPALSAILGRRGPAQAGARAAKAAAGESTADTGPPG